MSSTNTTRAVLIVEDEILIRALIADTLSCQGFKIYEAIDADEAIDILERHADVAIVFTDINMPGSMDGIRLAHFVRDRWPPVKFIVTSGKTFIKNGDLPIDAIFLSKPYSPDFVAQTITRLIAA